MPHETSAGVIVYHLTDRKPQFLLLHYEKGHWDFPKGNIEKGEEPLDTVRREVEEETGIKNIEIIPGFKREIEYYYRRSGELVHKQVIYLLAKTTTRAVTLSAEHQNYAWLDFEKSVDRVTYRNSKTILREAAKFLGEGSKRRGESAQ